ncbi:hypothetical protein CEXT_111351 [Caerostris extrusa]|uniref:Uncharacterized protein n=1 Tax=Caerostris extrusa TaxID=172846 RepID=A0AAV4RLR0_CAEEX|nr:hypothetical protein CEXT_111351 [Caerostris extrusa]
MPFCGKKNLQFKKLIAQSMAQLGKSLVGHKTPPTPFQPQNGLSSTAGKIFPNSPEETRDGVGRNQQTINRKGVERFVSPLKKMQAWESK